MLGSLSFQEIAFILLLALLIFGPRRLPEMGKMLGRAMGEFRRASTELRRTFNTEISLEEDEQKPITRRRLDSREAAPDLSPGAAASKQPQTEPEGAEASPPEPHPARAVARGRAGAASGAGGAPADGTEADTADSPKA